MEVTTKHMLVAFTKASPDIICYFKVLYIHLCRLLHIGMEQLGKKDPVIRSASLDQLQAIVNQVVRITSDRQSDEH